MPDKPSPDIQSSSLISLLNAILSKFGPIGLLLNLAFGVPLIFYREWALHNGRLFLLAFIGCNLAVLALCPVARFFGFIGERGKEKFRPGFEEALNQVFSWVGAFFADLIYRHRRTYNKIVEKEYRLFNEKGLTLANTYRLDLEQVFVDLRIASGDPNQPNANMLLAKELGGNSSIWEILRARNFESGVALAFIGPPGCGKSTLLQHVALTFAKNRQRKHRSRAYVPIFLALREHIEAITRDAIAKRDIAAAPSLGKLAHDHFTKNADFTPRADWFERLLHAGKCVVLLDGLDEVAEGEKRRLVSRWVDAQVKRYDRCRFVVTSRPQGYLAAPLERANCFEVQNFSSNQIRRFIENWHLANEMAANPTDKQAARALAEKEAHDLRNRLVKSSSLDELTVNPLLLTMIVMVHRYRGALPGSRVELYKEICVVLLEHWRKVRDIKDDGVSAERKLIVLRPLAAHMMNARTREITVEQATDVIRKTVSDSVSNFFKGLSANSGLLLERERGRWSFVHLTFQEYLAGMHWRQPETNPPDWNALVRDSWWHETLQLYAAQSDATPIVAACLERADSVPALTLAAECLEEAREIAPETRAAAEKRLIAALESPDAKLRNVAAEVRLARRVKSLRRIDDDRAIDPEFLSCAEYQLFLDEMRAKGEYRQPDHWTALTFSAGAAQSPIAGVRAEDAAAFCAWLTDRDAKYAYRLPTAAEVVEFPSRISNLGAWSADTSGFSITGLSENNEAVICKTLSQMGSLLPVPRTLDLDLALDYNINRSLARNPDWSIAQDPDRALAYDLAGALDLNLAFNRTFAFDHTLKFTYALDRALNYLYHTCVLEDMLQVTSRRDLPSVKSLLQVSYSNADERNQTIIALIIDMVDMAMTADVIFHRRTARRFARQILEYAYPGYDMLAKEEVSWWRRLFSRGAGEWEAKKQTALDLYWSLKIIAAREAGELPAWEGIRIVRERKTDAK